MVFRKFISNRNEKKQQQKQISRYIYIGLAILSLSKMTMYEYWYDDMKPKYRENIRLCYMDMDSLIMHIKREDFFKDIANDVEKNYDASNYVSERPLPRGKNKNKIELMKNELGGKIMKKIVGSKSKCYATLMDDDNGEGTKQKEKEHKAKGTKNA